MQGMQCAQGKTVRSFANVFTVLALRLAILRGVQVEVLIPLNSNHRLSDLARVRALRELAEAGARVRLSPVMMHGKLVVVGDQLALSGSANLDARSLFLNYELMFAFHAPVDVKRFADWFELERAKATAFVAKPPGILRDVEEGILLWIAFQL